MEVSAEAYIGLGIVGAVRNSLYSDILWLEKIAKNNDCIDLFIDSFKNSHDQLRDAEKYICKGLGMNEERTLAGTKYDTPRMLPDDHYYNTKEDIPFETEHF